LLFAGDGYEEASSLLIRLSPILLLVASYGVLSNLQVALDHVGTLVRINLGGLALKVALNLFAIPAYGAEGAAATAVMAETVVVAAQWFAARDYFEASRLLAWSGRLLLATVAMLAVGLAVLAALPWPPALAAGLAAFLLTAWLADCISASELHSIRSSLRVGA
jgi:O-antigen/teichoic acid export membrane protein